MILRAYYSIVPTSIDGTPIYEGQYITTENDDGTITTHLYPGSKEIEKWISEGNVPEPTPTFKQEPLTAQQKLEAAGLTIEELKDLLGI